MAVPMPDWSEWFAPIPVRGPNRAADRRSSPDQPRSQPGGSTAVGAFRGLTGRPGPGRPSKGDSTAALALRVQPRTRLGSLAAAWNHQYVLLAGRTAELLPGRTQRILEIGCGRGQLTVPLAWARPRARILAIDSFRPPYSRSQAALLASLRRSGLEDRVDVHRADGPRWLQRPRSARFQGIVSSEFLPELPVGALLGVFRACFRLLELGGSTVHIFLSPIPRNEQQRLVIEADSDPRWTRRPPKGWFSPPPSLACSLLRSAGFVRVRARRVPSRLRFSPAAALQQLTRWRVRPGFVREYGIAQGRNLLELPDWVVLSGVRLGAPAS